MNRLRAWLFRRWVRRWRARQEWVIREDPDELGYWIERRPR